MSAGSKSRQLRTIGERKAVELITSLLTPGGKNVKVGPGDDCAAIQIGKDYLVITTDMTTEKTHFPPNISPYQVGWYVVAINLSDLAAKGAKPLGVVVAAGLPKDYDTDFIEDMIDGMNSCATTYGTAIIGGDLKAHEHLTLTGTAIGSVPANEFMPRRGAHKGDILGMTGALGHAGAGYYTLKHELLPEHEANLIGLFEPKPKLAEGLALAKSGVVTSCMDISDGLAHSLYQLSDLNEVGFDVVFDDIPLDPEAIELAEKLAIPIEDMTIYFGGDYELLVTVKKDGWAKAAAAVKSAGSALKQIGIVTDKPDLNLFKDGSRYKLKNRGYEHFKWKG